jgi:hypothetical protein
MLLFRGLLVNEVQSFERVVEECVAPLSSSIELLAATRPDATVSDFEEMLRDEFTREPAARLAAPRNVWFNPGEADTKIIPEDAWWGLLTLGLRAVTHIEGFSFCKSDREEPGQDPGVPTRAILDELERIVEILAPEVAAAPVAVPIEEEHEDDVVHAQPLTETEIREITGEVAAEEVAALRAKLAESETVRQALVDAWNQLYEGVVGTSDRSGPPRESDDPRVPLIANTMTEAIECITQVFRAVAHFGGDELGENIPKIRVFIQDALREMEGGKEAPEELVRKIKRQMKVVRMFLFGVVQVFLEAHSHATKLGTKSLVRLLDKGLFEPVTKGRKEREPDAEEIRRRFQHLAESLPEKHQRVFQPFFQEYVREKLKKAT